MLVKIKLTNYEMEGNRSSVHRALERCEREPANWLSVENGVYGRWT